MAAASSAAAPGWAAHCPNSVRDERAAWGTEHQPLTRMQQMGVILPVEALTLLEDTADEGAALPAI